MGLGFRVRGFVSRARGLGFRVTIFGILVFGEFELRAWGWGFGVEGLGSPCKGP